VLSLNKNPAIAYSGSTNKPILGTGDWNQNWVAVYTKPRQEKSLARDLQERRISYFLPMVMRQTSSGGRRRKNLYPLFASYMFYSGGEAERIAVLRTERLVRVIDVDDSQQETFRRELASLELAIRLAPESLELHPRIAPGTRVVIRSGPMSGVEGVVLEVGGKRKLWLGVSTLGVGATVEIHPDLVEPV
jgi:transcriptional antiterminator RfaH